MPSYWNVVNDVLHQADLIIEVLDARMIEQTRNREIEEKISRLNKKILYVITKCDLVSHQQVEKAAQRLSPSVFISAKDKFGTTVLLKKILEISHGEPVLVGVLGYPNVGKSSLINALAGRHAAKTSPHSGFTRHLQKIKVNSKIVILDTPGVFPLKEKNEIKHAQTGAVSYDKIKDPEAAVLQLISDQKKKVQWHYQVDGDDPEELLEHIAIKLGKLLKGGLPNLELAAIAVLKDWQTGKIKIPITPRGRVL